MTFLLRYFLHLTMVTTLIFSRPFPFENGEINYQKNQELKDHFPTISSQEFNEIANILDLIEMAAQRRFYEQQGPNESIIKQYHKNDNDNNDYNACNNNNNNNKFRADESQPDIAFNIDALLVPINVRETLSRPNADLPIAKYLFEGDILLTGHQAQVILKQLLSRQKRSISNNHIREKRKMYTRNESKWVQFPIKYFYHESLDASTIELIETALGYWQNNTCIDFRQIHHVNPRSRMDYFEFFQGQGCYSIVGKVGGRQGISIGSRCHRLGTIEHEIGHALGLWHEQSRPDSDCCIDILADNIRKRFLSNFLKRSWDEVSTFGVPYDLGSVMHYSSTAFTNDWTKSTVRTLDRRYQMTIGQREKLSFYDLKIVNMAYCRDVCTGQELKTGAISMCHFNGYANPRNCRECICPDGTGGQFCQTNEPSKGAICGGLFDLDQNNIAAGGNGWQLRIESPGYPGPGTNRIGRRCSWIIRTKMGSRILLEFLDKFGLLCSRTCLDYVEVKVGEDFGKTGFRFCCNEKPKSIESETNQMIVIFHATASTNIGFRARLKSVEITVEIPNRKTALFTPQPAAVASNLTTNKTTSAIRTSTDTSILTTSSSLSSKSKKKCCNSNDYGSWSKWSECSRTCGGCGKRSRRRHCLVETCDCGNWREFENCNPIACVEEKQCTRITFFEELCSPFSRNVCSRQAQIAYTCTRPICCSSFVLKGYQCIVKEAKTLANKTGITEEFRPWGEWSGCVGPECGGCAVQTRQRFCLGDEQCQKAPVQYRPCRLTACEDCSVETKETFLTKWHCRGIYHKLCDLGRKFVTEKQFNCPCCHPLNERHGLCLPYVLN